MDWVCGIALYMVLSGLLLEIIADTKYYKFAKWVAGILLLLQFAEPLTHFEELEPRFFAKLSSFDYALGTERILEKLYESEEQTNRSVLEGYKENVTEQVDRLLKKNGLSVRETDMEVAESGELVSLYVRAQYMDGNEAGESVGIPTVIPVRIIMEEEPEPEVVSPVELYIREMLAEFYQMDENKIEVVIQEAD